MKFQPMKWQKFRKKPIVVEAFLLTKDMLSVINNYFRLSYSVASLKREKYKQGGIKLIKDGLLIKTLEGDIKANIGDWIIKGINGEIYPCKPDIFEKTYEKTKN